MKSPKPSKISVCSAEPENKDTTDVTGQSRFKSNVLHSWGGSLVVFVAGFITPRLIDRHLGQTELGVWDFSWSFVSYLQLSMLGIGSSINRYIAGYRAVGDNYRLNRAISTVVCLQAGIAAIVLISALILAWITPIFFGQRLGEHTNTARWTVALLGASLAVNMAFDTSRGVLTGCHRWDLHTRINSISKLVELLGMLLVLLSGGGIPLLGGIVLFAAIATGCWRYKTARRLCPEIKFQMKLFQWGVAHELMRFGMKSFIAEAPLLLLVQTTNLFLVRNLGPQSLAIFSRSLGLVRNTEVFMNKFAFTLSPTAGSLQGMGKEEELRRFFLETTRYGVAFAAPALFFLIIDGDLILRLWMGERYMHGSILTILALGSFLPIAQNSVREILKGMNAHGKMGIVSFCAACACFLVGFVILSQLGWSLNSAAILLATSLTAGLGFVPATFACHKLKISYGHYLRYSLFPPLACNIIYVSSLLAGRQFFPNNIAASTAMGVTGALLLTILYLRYIFPKQGKALLDALRQGGKRV